MIKVVIVEVSVFIVVVVLLWFYGWRPFGFFLLSDGLFEANALEEEGDGLVAIYFKPIGTDQILLVEHCVVGAQEPKILELQQKKVELVNTPKTTFF